VYNCTVVPSAGLAPATSTHLPAKPLICPVAALAVAAVITA
jgi:hypothetical protein